jgi:hypothetical protein
VLIVSATTIVGAAIAERATTIRRPSWGRAPAAPRLGIQAEQTAVAPLRTVERAVDRPSHMSGPLIFHINKRLHRLRVTHSLQARQQQIFFAEQW